MWLDTKKVLLADTFDNWWPSIIASVLCVHSFSFENKGLSFDGECLEMLHVR